ncbi:hypothetical protein GH714_007484 [Hevea brasiliensis]|uniref:Uncharacterized protein n=1 Tax=Hevea brasiliensis TaxID=3981 RepID=A0A6A6MXC4_HEVBR|nr:hypothetical protein GH714_007417 [Hevea brasiliensis]KAF2318434.1 hypothetical protein GH714_007484 [Hevea brasiliensis]
MPSPTSLEVPATLALAPMTSSTLSSSAISGQRAIPLANIVDPLQDLHFSFLAQFSSRVLIQKAQSYMVQAREREDEVKAIIGKVVDLEEQISRLKAEITKLKSNEASLMWLEDDLLVEHMIDKGVILSKGDALRELATPTEAKIQEHQSCLDFLASCQSHWAILCDSIVSHFWILMI